MLADPEELFLAILGSGASPTPESFAALEAHVVDMEHDGDFSSLLADGGDIGSDPNLDEDAQSDSSGECCAVSRQGGCKFMCLCVDSYQFVTTYSLYLAQPYAALQPAVRAAVDCLIEHQVEQSVLQLTTRRSICHHSPLQHWEEQLLLRLAWMHYQCCNWTATSGRH
jgi:hypothetical protein